MEPPLAKRGRTPRADIPPLVLPKRAEFPLHGHDDTPASTARAFQKQRKFACTKPGCAYDTVTSKRLREHELQPHGSAREHSCTARGCSFACCTAQELRHHVRFSHTADELSFPCREPGCGAVFKTRPGFEFHVRAVHLRQRPFVCAEPGCSFAASQRAKLRAHQRTHAPGARARAGQGRATAPIGAEAREGKRPRMRLSAEGAADAAGGAGEAVADL